MRIKQIKHRLQSDGSGLGGEPRFEFSPGRTDYGKLIPDVPGKIIDMKRDGKSRLIIGKIWEYLNNTQEKYRKGFGM
jgi:hypothetical protein